MSFGSGVVKRPVVVLEGCGFHVNGWLWPAFERHVREGRITLCVTDVGPIPVVADKIREYVERRGQNLWYIDKSKKTDRDTLALLRPACVYVATPDHVHCRNITEWLLPVARTDLVIVEKPFAPHAQDITSLSEALRSAHGPDALTLVKQIDNYFIRALFARKHMGDALARVGPIGTVAAWVTESRLVEMDRDLPGMILDLMPHALAALRVIGRIPEQEQEKEQGKWTIKGAAWARYPGAYMLHGVESAGGLRGSFRLHATPDRHCDLTIVVGKGIGFRDQKHIDLISTTGDLAARLSFLKPESTLSVGVRLKGRRSRKRSYYPEVRIAPLEYNAHEHFVNVLVGWLHGERQGKKVHELLFDIDQARTTIEQIDQAYGLARGKGEPLGYRIGAEPRFRF